MDVPDLLVGSDGTMLISAINFTRMKEMIKTFQWITTLTVIGEWELMGPTEKSTFGYNPAVRRILR